MSKRKKHTEAADELLDREPALKEPGESRASLAVTVLWCLVGLATALLEVGVLAAGVIMLWHKPIGDEKEFFERMFGMLYVASCFSGLMLLALTPVVYRFRDTPPPVEITWLAIFLGALPFVTGIFFYFLG